ncbi:ATP-dependent endonuclease [Clostridium gasigenes]|uniref:AAA family ATPase n=1 Tax=Clostridium gasigenes TaxID=94869 RepID=UPI001C0E3641|nr:ATP-dependent endonuclease [Clostridium gasigenes]MBU3135817.1 ATP-dependent endonuclease [Clostridium gasigenes]
MKISKIKVSNYRLLKEFELDLEEELSLIIGKNNCGKTSLLSILDKFIGSKSNVNNFSYDDFSVHFQKELKEIIKNDYSPIENDKLFPMGISMKLFIKYCEDDDLSNISDIMIDLDPENKNIILGFEYSLCQEEFNKLKLEFNKYKKIRFNKEENNGNKDELRKKYFEDFIKTQYKKFFKISRKSILYDLTSNNEKDDEYIDLDKNKISLDNIINFKFISAQRSVSNIETDNTLSNLSSKYYDKIEENDEQKVALDKFKEQIISTDRQLDEIYDSLFNDVVNKVKMFGGTKPGESVIQIVSSLKRKELLKGNTTVMYKHNDSNLLPENYNGLGYLNLISMILEIEVDLSEFRKDGKENKKPSDINLFFIEEPEAHTHPQMQYVFIKNIKNILKEGCSGAKGKNSFDMQTIITSHSSHIVSEGKFSDIKYFYKTRLANVVAKNLKDLETQYSKAEEKEKAQFKFLKQYLTLNRSELFFADKAILIEGDTERILLPAMMKKIDQIENVEGGPMLSQNISIVEVGAYAHIFERFISFIGIKSLIITDIDSAKVEEKKNEDGTLKKNSNGEVKKGLKSCRVDDVDAIKTTNASLNFFYLKDLKEKWGEDENQLQYLKELSFDEKRLIRNSETNNWNQCAEGEVAVTYQVPDDDINGTLYHATSFEDAFFHINREFIIDNIGSFESLKNIKYFGDRTKDSYYLAENCVDKKPSFAMEILLNSNMDGDGNEFSNWDIPNYIKEGLLWLKED